MKLVKIILLQLFKYFQHLLLHIWHRVINILCFLHIETAVCVLCGLLGEGGHVRRRWIKFPCCVCGAHAELTRYLMISNYVSRNLHSV